VCFATILRLAIGMFAVPMASIALLEDVPRWLHDHHRLEVAQSPLDRVLTAQVPGSEHVRILPDVLADERFASTPMVIGAPHVQIYAPAPTVSRDGSRLGALAILDRSPPSISLIGGCWPGSPRCAWRPSNYARPAAPLSIAWPPSPGRGR
jgi:hypothetical protein